MSKNNARFTGKKIASAGFVELSPGVYGKRDSRSEADNTKPQANKLERTAEEGLACKSGFKKGGKKTNSTGYYYQLLVISFRTRPIDASNGCSKYIEDALVVEGILPDDNIFFCPRPPILHQILDTPPEEHKTIVLVFRYDQNNERGNKKSQ
tara:strand:+ start:7242 stop:7697 length:456 start_codon:yes stop_codon:yes gene_type:complete